MSQYDYEEDDFDAEVDESSLSGNDLVKKLRKQISAMSKAIKERDEVLSEYAEAAYQESIADTLSSWGLNPRIAAFVPDDIETEDELSEWLEEYGDAFADGSSIESDEPVEEASPLDMDSLYASELMADVEDGSFDPEVGLDLQNRLQGAQSPEELLAMLKG
jgi:hypothetical protein